MAKRFTTLVLLVVMGQFAAGEVGGAPKADPGKNESQAAEAAKGQVFEGKVLLLADVVKEESPAADEDGLKVGRVLQTDGGKTYSLVKDVGSRKFFMDDRLIGRPMQITAVKIPGTQMLVITQARSIVNGKLHDIDYWCEQCQLAATEPGICKCCGSVLELRELPVEPQE